MPRPVAALTSGLLARKGQARPAQAREELPEAGTEEALPPVLATRALLAEEIAAPADAGRRTAFTLRLDAARHRALRLAAATSGLSAQQIVTRALDAYLTAMPEASSGPQLERKD